jgi:hypothetical protein
MLAHLVRLDDKDANHTKSDWQFATKDTLRNN